ncbi:MAG: histidine phosphatase family protein [Desulfatitalea sp.]|nr:histidine phosphatase family protein [Desulfatitalea sp.]
MLIQYPFITFCIVSLFLSAATDAGADKAMIDALNAGGYVLLVRHAFAPGQGDPIHFKIGDCATQRNLDDRGRAQARAIGSRLRAGGIASARVYSSQWCRSRETAELIALGPVTELPALNSFFQQPKLSETTLAAMKAFLAQQPPDGELILLVTHFVNISGLAGITVSSGDGVVLQLTGRGDYRVVGRLAFDPNERAWLVVDRFKAKSVQSKARHALFMMRL